MPGIKRIEAKQVKSLGETPAEARARMKPSEEVPAEAVAEVEQPQGTEVEGPLTPEHLAAIEEAEGGFRDTDKADGPPQDMDNLAEPPSPDKAMEVIREQANRVNQLTTELDAALNLIHRYRGLHGDLD